MNIKILHVLGDIKVESGICSLIMNTYRKIDQNEFQFDFLVCNKKEPSYEEEILKLGGSVFYCGNLLSAHSIIQSKKMVDSFFLEKAKDYDIVHLHAPTLSYFILRSAKKNGVKSRIVHSHSSMTSTNQIKKLLNLVLRKQSCIYANYFWTCSHEAASFLYGDRFMSTHVITTIPNAIDYERFQFDELERKKTRKELGLDGKMVYIHVSNFSKIKNLLFFTEIIQDICRIREDAHFLFVGEGETTEQVKKAITDNNLMKRVTFAGLQKEIRSFLAAADAFVLPSIKEGLPVTVIEAQANGLPCFVSDTITRECDLGLVHYIPLVKTEWSRLLGDMNTSDNDIRFKQSRGFLSTRFYINTAVKDIENEYRKLY